MMTPDRWQQIKDTFHAALERAPGERATFLVQVCAGDDLLQREIESLIQAHDETGKFVDAPAYEKLADLAAHGQGLAAGESIGRYAIVSQLGKGGMGAVYLAHDSQLERNVAIKLLPSYFANDSDRLRRFAQEARAASALNHPNILTIYEIGETDATRFIVTEFIDGLTLRQRLAQSPLSLAEAVEIAISVAAALEAAHRVKIVHRDIKPENIMLRSDDGLVKVIDFGLAKATERPTSGAPDHEASVKALLDTAPGVIMGTVAYMSPEQARAQDVDARTDIWSLGVVLYEMVTGRVPFAGETPSHVIVSVLESEPEALASDGELPVELERIVIKALRKDKEERYQTASELVQELKDLKQGLERGWTTTKHDGRTAFDAVLAAPERITTAGTIQRTTKTEYLVSQIKRHQRAAFIVSPIVVVCLLGLVYWLTRPAPPPKTITQVKSIAVLPFKNIGGKEDEEYLGQGLSEVLITKLSNIKTIVVRPTSAVMKYRDATPDPRKIGNDLNVEALVMGRVQKVDDNIRVTVQLVRVSDGATLWAETFDDKFTNIFGVQDSIANQVTESLAITLTSGERQHLAKRDTSNTEAFQLYLQGRYFWNKRSEEGLKKAVEFFSQATGKDPGFARAYSGLADSYMLMGILDLGMNLREAITKAEAAAQKAIALDDTLAEAHTSLAFISYTYDFDWVNAERQFRRAIELNPNYATAHHWYSLFLSVVKRFDESEAEMKTALQLDPSSLIINVDYGSMFYYSRRYDQAVAQYKKTLELEPRFALAHQELARVYTMQQRYDDAIAEFNQAIEISGRRPYFLSLLGLAYGMSGRRTEAEKLLQELEALSKQRIVLPHNFVTVYLGLNDKKKAMEWMEINFKERHSALIVLGIEPRYDSLRDEPRFQEMLKELKLN